MPEDEDKDDLGELADAIADSMIETGDSFSNTIEAFADAEKDFEKSEGNIPSPFSDDDDDDD